MNDAPETSVNEPAHAGQLLRILGLGFGLAVVIGGVIGVSIFRLPGPIAGLLGSAWLVMTIWVAGGIYTLVSANLMAELATMLPRAGGVYVFVHRAFGAFPGFSVGWISWLGDTAAIAFMCIAFGEFSISLFGLSNVPVAVLATGLLLSIAGLNAAGIRIGSWFQQFLSVLKALSLVAFVAACFLFGGAADTTPSSTAIAPPATPIALITALLLSFQLIIGAYGGWTSAVYFSEEDVDPGRNIPRALHLGVVAVIVIYLLVNAGLIYVLPFAELAGSKLAAADAMTRIFGSSGGRIVTALAIISVVGIVNVVVMYLPRALYGLGRDGFFSMSATMVSSGGTPLMALSVTTLVALVLILIGTFEILMAVYAFFSVALNILITGSLFALRKSDPDLVRPFRVWGYPILPAVLLLVQVALFFGFIFADPITSGIALVALALSFPVFLLVRSRSTGQSGGA
jgi:basic amino acid/polyamine antiporter, APA family